MTPSNRATLNTDSASVAVAVSARVTGTDTASPSTAAAAWASATAAAAVSASEPVAVSSSVSARTADKTSAPEALSDRPSDTVTLERLCRVQCPAGSGWMTRRRPARLRRSQRLPAALWPKRTARPSRCAGQPAEPLHQPLHRRYRRPCRPVLPRQETVSASAPVAVSGRLGADDPETPRASAPEPVSDSATAADTVSASAPVAGREDQTRSGQPPHPAATHLERRRRRSREHPRNLRTRLVRIGRGGLSHQRVGSRSSVSQWGRN